ncbi:hypothetical protein L2Y96_12940 [Luteibacter aegosomaticola]|uniref:hypothetical protein n=1 Tax=Luteibacter aegosomaticola TaxID=2911538 RepID=UPI001FF8C869|nr:hypothetical protein [Luteibacter aegosomaticola]UPG88327.1 hypothetical protein L2Y96_12940 [Luteibacter aegosomaticola]
MLDVNVRSCMAKVACVLVGMCLAGHSLAQSAAVTPESEYQKRVKVSEDIQPVGDHPFGENISLYNGALSFDENDVTLPGQGPDIVISRSFRPADVPPQSVYYDFIDNALVDWSLETPRIETLSAASSTANLDPPPDAQWYFLSDAQRCSSQLPAQSEFVSFKGTVITYPAENWWHGIQLIVPGQGSQDVLTRDTANTQTPAMVDTSGNAIVFPWLTKARWAIGCLPSTSNGQPGEGFLAVSPEGMRYYMDALFYQRTDYVAEGGGGALHRRLVTMKVSRIVDRFGNTVNYHYDVNGNLTQIDSPDGRTVSLGYDTWQNPAKDASGNFYDPPGYRLRSVTAQPGSAHPRTWTYNYTTDPVIPRLSSVQLPDGSAWSFNLGGFAPLPGDGSLIMNAGCDYTLRPQDAVASQGSITQPSGVTGTFYLQSTIRGRSYVPYACLNVNGSFQTNYPAAYKQNSLVRRELSGAGIGTLAWTYSYSSPNDSWSTCTTGCPTTVTTEMVDPSNRTTRYTFSNRFDASESLLLQSTLYTGNDTSTAVRTETTDYALPPDDGSWPYPWPKMLGATPVHSINPDQAGRLVPVTKKTTGQDGDTYTWAAQSFDAFANPAQVQRYSSVAGQTDGITETTGYLNDPAYWVLGQTLQVVKNLPLPAETEAVNTYTAQDELLTRARFGQTLMTYGYNGAGQLASYTDGNQHTTTLTNYVRSIPGLVTYPDASTEQFGVDEFSEVSSVTNQAGNATSYAYDSVGRLAQITYPAGDTVGWAPRVFSYAFVGVDERGVPANHWRRTIDQGDRTDVTYFDALLRPMLAGRSRASDGGLATTTVTVHDWKGNVTFQSYADDGAKAFTEVTDGISTNYDPLSRPIQRIQPSETGVALTTVTAYLSGARIQVTDPNSNSTTTSYQVFDTPSQDRPILVQAPETVTQVIARDIYGNPLTISQGGIDKQFVYDSFKRVCRTFEPETQSTVSAFDGANNVIWTAKGQQITGDGCGQDQVAVAAQVSRSYDNLNRVTEVDYPGASPVTTRVSYTPTGKLNTEDSGLVHTAFAYNKRDLQTGESLSVDGYLWPVGYGYDVNGALSAMTYPDGKAVTFAPDAFGRPTQAGAYASTASYWPDDIVEHMILGNGVDYLSGENARKLLMSLSYAVGTTPQLELDYSYDNNANISLIHDAAGSTHERSFKYDGLNRLSEANSDLWGGKETYVYDARNNVASITTGTASPSTVTYTYDVNNLLQGTSGAVSRTFAYDPHGNVTTNGTSHYTYDGADRMSAVTSISSSYAYDAEDRRVKATGSGTTTYSFYDHGGQLLWQYDPVGNTGTDYIYLGKHLVASTKNVLIPSLAPALTAPSSAQGAVAYTVSWTSVPTASSYELQEEPDGGAWADISNAASLSKSVTHPSAGTFHYQVRACNAGGCGTWSAIATTVVSAPPSAPAAPASVTATPAANLLTVSVSWPAVDTATSYNVEQRIGSGAWSSSTAVPGTSTSVSSVADGAYAFQVQACSQYGCSAWTLSNTVTVQHTPGAPASINVQNPSSGSIAISWPAVTYGQTYAVGRSTDNVNFSDVYYGAATSTTQSVGSTGTYWFRVRACNSTNGTLCSANSPSAGSVVTIPPSQAPGISVPGTSSNGCYTVTWNGVAGATSYTMQEQVNGGGFANIANNGSGALGICGKGNGTYGYRVQGCNAGGCGPFSGTATVTVALIPAAPTDLTWSLTGPATKRTVHLAWNASTSATSYQVIETLSPDPQQLSGLQWTGNATTYMQYQVVTATAQYWVRACNASGCSGNSNGVAISLQNGSAFGRVAEENSNDGK